MTGGIDALARHPEEPVAPVWNPLGLRAEDLPRGPEVRADPAPGAPTGERAGAPAALLASVNGHTMPAFRVVPPGPAVDVDVGVEAAGRSPEAASDVSPAFVPLLGSRGRHLACGPAGADHAAEPPAPERPSAGPATGSRR